MRIKLDENLPADLAELLRAANHDVATLPEERLAGAKDPTVAGAVNREDRLLVDSPNSRRAHKVVSSKIATLRKAPLTVSGPAQ
jgi:predicted nuclease of predicted toxin-antitoxin system